MKGSTIETKLRRFAEKRGCIAHKYKTPGRRFAPDRIILASGRHVFFIEVKGTGDALSPGQIREFTRLRRMGFRVHILKSIEQIADIFDEEFLGT